jgi:CubicO group peptidase (beta-lactamase class C family)
MANMTEISAASVTDPPLDGHCAPGFEAVRDAFRTNFIDDGDWGAAACVIVDGRCIVDIWGGYQDLARQQPWNRDTLVNAYSVGKGVLAILVLDAVERREIEFETRISRVWPEFSAAGKEGIRLRTLLAHRAGLPAIRPMLPPNAKYDWAWICRLLAGEVPFWEPGSAHGYHSNTFGYLVGEVLRRATGTPVGQLLRERLAGPAGADFYWGLPQVLHERVAPVLLTSEASIETQQAQGAALVAREHGTVDHRGMVWRGYFNPPGMSGFGSVNTADWRNATIPSTNGHANARAIARLYDALLGGVPRSGGGRRPVASAALRAEATRIHSDGEDLVLERRSRFGLGFQLSQPDRPIGPGPKAFGHFGHGGSLGFADPEIGLAFGYVTNRPGARFLASRAKRIADSVYAAF